jgi:Excalibur calcium-binding domain
VTAPWKQQHPAIDDLQFRISRRPSHAPTQGSPRRAPEPTGSGSFGSVLVALLLVAGVGWFGYTRYTERVGTMPSAPQSLMRPAQTAAPEIASPAFHCDGRKHCSQMSSCSEAKQFLQNCPGMEMDGDNDGIPCEQQLCSGPLGGG